MSNVLAIPEQAESLPEVVGICETVDRWLPTTDDIGAISDTIAKLGAIGEYLRLTSTEGRGRIMLTARLAQARIGELTPKEKPVGRAGGKDRDSRSFLSPDQRHKARKIAEHADLIHELGSTDDDPLTENKLLERIRHEERSQENLRRLTPDDFDPAENRELIRQRGALVRLCTEIANLGDPVDFALRNAQHLDGRHYDAATHAIDWLTAFTNTEQK